MRRLIKYIYIIYLAICIIMTAVSAGKTEENVQVVKYGLSTDDTVKLDESTTISSEMVLTGDTLKGITVKFQADSEFQNERLHAVLSDTENGEILAEDRIALKNERIQNKDSGSTIYLSLPVEDARGKQVRLELSLEGEDVRVCPAFVVSDSEVEESVLWVNDEEQEQALVFSARYSLGETRNIADALISGLLWVIVGSLFLLYLCTDSEKRSEKTFWTDRLIEMCSLLGDLFCSFVRKGRKWIGCITVLGVSAFLLLYVYQYSVEKAIVKCKVHDVIASEEEEADFYTLNQSVPLVKQTLLCNYDNASAVVVYALTGSVSSDTQLNVSVLDETTGRMLAETVLITDEALDSEVSELRIAFPETLEGSKGHELSVTLELIDAVDTEIMLQTGKNKTKNYTPSIEFSTSGNQTKDAGTEKGYIAVSIETGNVDFLIPLYLIFSVLLVMVVLLIYICCFSKRVKAEGKFVALALSLGILFNFLIGLNTVPDEPSHMDTAYSISNEIMGIPASEKTGYLYKRADDVDPVAEEKQSLNAYSYERLYNQFFEPLEDDTLVECAGRNNLGNASLIYYLPQAVGLTVGRLLHLGTMPIMMLARLFSLFTYVGIMYFAIKKMPFAKVPLLMIGTLPITLQQAASFSYDAMINAVAFLFISYSLSIIYGKAAVKFGDLAVMTITGVMLAAVKGGVYIPLCFLPLLALCRKERLTAKQKKYILAALCVFLFAFVKTNLIRTIKSLMAVQGTVTGGAASTEVYTFGYLLENPMQFIGMFVNTFYKQGDSYLRNMLGGNLAWREVNISWGIIFGFLIVILLSCIPSCDDTRISGWNKAYMGLLAFGSFFCIELSMLLVWTPVTYVYITGVQGRYFLPFFPLALLIVRNFFFSIKRNIENILIFSAGILNVLTLLQVIQYALA